MHLWFLFLSQLDLSHSKSILNLFIHYIIIFKSGHLLLWSHVESLRMSLVQGQEASRSPLHLKSCWCRYLAPPSGGGPSFEKACRWDFCTGSARNEKPFSGAAGLWNRVSSGPWEFRTECGAALLGWESLVSGPQEPPLAVVWWGWGAGELGLHPSQASDCPLFSWGSPNSQAGEEPCPTALTLHLYPLGSALQQWKPKHICKIKLAKRKNNGKDWSLSALN